MFKTIFAILTLFGLSLVGHSVLAEAVLTQHFNQDDTCYARQYSDEHLASHPNQTVARIEFGHFPSWYNEWVIDPEKGVIVFNVNVIFRDSEASFSNGGECRPEADGLNCQIECDGGGFTLTHKDADSILLHPRKNSGFVVAGCDGGEVRQITHKTDDKVFLLHRLPTAQCKYPQ